MTGPLWLAEVNLDTPAGVLVLGSGDVSALNPFLAESITIEWKREGNGQPDPVEGAFTVVSPTPVQVDIGRRVSLVVTDGADELATFYGRVAEVVAQPVEYQVSAASGLTLGMSYEVKCADYTVDLAEITANFPAYDPTVAPTMRFAGSRIVAYLQDGVPGYASGGVYGSAGGMDWAALNAEEAGSGGVLERVNAVMDQVGVTGLPGDVIGEPEATALDRRLHRRAIFAPRVDATTLPGDLHLYDGDGFPAHWALDAPPAYYTSDDPADFPGVFTDLGAEGWGLVMDDTSPVVVPAITVDYAARWRRDKFTHPNRVTVTYTPPGSSTEKSVTVDADDRDASAPIVNLPLDAPLLGATLPTYDMTDEYGPRRMALMYLPESDSRDRWTGEAFRFYPETWAALLHSPWFPRHADIDPTPATTPADPDQPGRAQCYATPVVISGIDPAHHPTGRDYYAGTLAAVKLTLADDLTRPVVEFTLRRSLPVPAGSGALTPGDLPATVTVADLSPDFTVYDYRLARGA